MTPLQRIRKETDMQACDAIRIHAEQGCSKLLTASTLGISRDTLFKLCTRFDLHGSFKPQSEQKEGCRQSGKKGSRARKYSTNELLLEVKKRGSLRVFKRDSRIPHTTVYYRFGSWVEGLRQANEFYLK
jgi:hypothetical protein